MTGKGVALLNVGPVRQAFTQCYTESTAGMGTVKARHVSIV